MTEAIFADWFRNCYLVEAEQFMRAINQDFRILLIMDNCPSHPTYLSKENVEVVFLPPNTTSLLQPLDQGIVKQFKQSYLKRTFQMIFEQNEEGKNLKPA